MEKEKSRKKIVKKKQKLYLKRRKIYGDRDTKYKNTMCSAQYD